MLGGSLCAVACGGTADHATKNRTFYDWTVATGASGTTEFEQRYPPLDFAATQVTPEYLGVSVVRGGVRLSRPKGWMLRDAGNVPGQAFVQYISPNAYSFAIYERPDSPGDSWQQVSSRYEDDTQSLGAKVAGKRIPMATGIGQGRAYTVERSVEAAKRPLLSRSREYLVRGDHRVVLVQIVHEGENLAAVEGELLRVVDTLEVL